MEADMISPLQEDTNRAALLANKIQNYWQWQLAPPTDKNVKLPLVCGIDLGSKHDHTSVILLEVEQRENERGEVQSHFLARHVKRMRLGITYPAVVNYVRELDAKLVEQCDRQPTYVVDATGLGQPVINYLRQEIDSARIKAVYITGGQEMHQQRHELHVPKQQLVSTLILLLQTGRIHLPKTSDSKALEQELLNYELKMKSAGGTPEMGAFRTGQHDDMVTALGLAVYYWQKARRRPARVIWF